MISLYEPFLYGGNINFPFFRIKRSLNGTLVHYYVQNDAKITIYFGSISPYITPFQILTVYLRYLNLFSATCIAHSLSLLHSRCKMRKTI